MKKINKPIVLKKKPCFVTWSLAVIVLFCVLVASYVFFNRGYEVVDFPDFKKAFSSQEKSPKISGGEATIPNKHRLSCYDGAYFNNIQLFLGLYLDFYKGYSLQDDLQILNDTNLHDKYLDQVVQYLRDLAKDDITISEKGIKKDFAVMKVEVLRASAKKRFADSSLLQSLSNAIIFYKKGNAALEAGGIEGTMEKAQIAINNDKIDEAYSLVLSLREPEYKEIASVWLKEVGYFIRIKEILEETKKYVFSDRYSGKFIKTCEQPNV